MIDIQNHLRNHTLNLFEPPKSTADANQNPHSIQWRLWQAAQRVPPCAETEGGTHVWHWRLTDDEIHLRCHYCLLGFGGKLDARKFARKPK